MSSDFWSRKWLLDQYNRTAAKEAERQAKPVPEPERPKYMDEKGQIRWRAEAKKPRIKAKTPPQSR
jgi:hypothetical protein